MKKDIHTLFNKAKKLTASNLPFSIAEIRSNFENYSSDADVYKSNKFISKKWRNTMITLSSILTGASICLIMLFNSSDKDASKTQTNKQAETKQEKITNREALSLLNTNDNIQQIVSNNSYHKDDKENLHCVLKSLHEVPPDSLMKKSSDFNWNEIEYDITSNGFVGKQVFSIINEEKKFIGARHYHVKIEFNDLIKVLDELKKVLSGYDYFGSKNIGYSDDKVFFDSLEKVLTIIKQKQKSDNLSKMFELYAIISHKIVNNSTGLKFLSLTNTELKNIGITVTDSSYEYKTETIEEKFPEWLDKYLTKHNYPKERNMPLLVKNNNYIYWCVNNKANNNFHNIVDGYTEPDLKKLDDKKENYKVFSCLATCMADYKGWNIDNYSDMCPLYSGVELRTGLNNSPFLYFGNGVLKDYYNKKNDYWINNSRWRYDSLDKIERDSLKKLDRIIMNDINRLQLNLLSTTLLPLKLVVPDTSNPKFKGLPTRTVYLLFIPTEAFLESLPKKYSVPLRKEIEAIKKIESGELPYFEACKGLSDQETFYDICRMESENIKDVKIYPNPSKDRAKLDFTLLLDRFINITLHDLNGNYIRDVVPWQKSSRNSYSFDIDLNNLERGMYLIIITTDKGEKVVQRIVVE